MCSLVNIFTYFFHYRNIWFWEHIMDITLLLRLITIMLFLKDTNLWQKFNFCDFQLKLIQECKHLFWLESFQIITDVEFDLPPKTSIRKWHYYWRISILTTWLVDNLFLFRNCICFFIFKLSSLFYNIYFISSNL